MVVCIHFQTHNLPRDVECYLYHIYFAYLETYFIKIY